MILLTQISRTGCLRCYYPTFLLVNGENMTKVKEENVSLSFYDITQLEHISISCIPFKNFILF